MQKTLYIPIDTTLQYTFECPLLVKRYDTIKFKFAVFDTGVLKDLTKQTINLILRKSDGTNIEKTITDKTLNIASITLDKQATVCVGQVEGEVILTDSTGQITTNTFKFNIINSLTEDVQIKSEDSIDTLQDMRALIAAYKNEIQAIGESIQATEALNNITTYIESNLSELTSKNATAVKNVADLKKENDRADTNIPGLTNLNDTAEDKLEEFRLYDTTELNRRVQENTSQLKDNVNKIENVKTDLNIKIDSLASGSPKAVASVSEMTDTTKNYVLATDGNWYYYNGSDWVSGGTYQSTGIANDSIEARMTTFNKTTKNEFDYNNPNCMFITRSSVGQKLGESLTSKWLFFKCQKNQLYSIYRDDITPKRFGCCYIDDEPAVGVAYYNWVENNNGNLLTITTGENAKYIGVYYYNSDFDSADELLILKSIMIQKGAEDNTKFIEHKIINVKYGNLDEDVIKEIEYSKNNVNKIITNDRFKSRSKIYGVKFNLNSSETSGERIADAVGLKNDYTILNDYQNGGINDFDNIFPWCEIRLCNLSVNDGVKKVTYESEMGFALDGTNGNVMVEIPKFYTKREVIGNEEIICITGEQKSGFEVEPAFINGNKELDYIYVSAYLATNNPINTNVFSLTNSSPMNTGQLYKDIDKFATAGYTPYDFSIFLMIQALFTVEFADRDNKPYMKGVADMPYYYYGQKAFLIQDVLSNNKVVVKNTGRLSNLVVGNQIGLGHTEGDRNTRRTIVSIEEDSTNNTRTIEYDGDELTLVAGTDSVYGIAQTNGMCDVINYHTGRVFNKNGVSPFKYHYMENLWGNMWCRLGGLKVKELEYYYSFNTDDYKKEVDDPTATWEKLNYKVPNQHYMGLVHPWVVKEGYDQNNRRISLPTICGETNGGGVGKYYSSGFFSYYDKDYNDNAISDTTKEYTSAMGGSWDAEDLASPYTIRCWIDAQSDKPDDMGWHYGNRIVYRK